MFKAGTVFRYKVTETVGGRPEGIPCEEVYRIMDVDGDSVKAEVSSESGKTQTMESDTSFGSYVFDTRGFSVKSGSPIQVEFEDSVVYVDVLVPARSCLGGSETIFLGRDGVVYKDVKTQMWSGGIIRTEIRELVSVESDGCVYDDIRWIEEAGHGKPFA